MHQDAHGWRLSLALPPFCSQIRFDELNSVVISTDFSIFLYTFGDCLALNLRLSDSPSDYRIHMKAVFWLGIMFLMQIILFTFQVIKNLYAHPTYLRFEPFCKFLGDF